MQRTDVLSVDLTWSEDYFEVIKFLCETDHLAAKAFLANYQISTPYQNLMNKSVGEMSIAEFICALLVRKDVLSVKEGHYKMQLRGKQVFDNEEYLQLDLSKKDLDYIKHHLFYICNAALKADEEFNGYFSLRDVFKAKPYYLDNEAELDKIRNSKVPCLFKEIHCKFYNFTNADFSHTSLEGVSLKGAILRDVRMRNAYMRNVDLSETNLSNASILYSDLAGVNFEHANLENCHLAFANLQKANFCEANLTKADLTESVLCDAQLKNVCMKEVKLYDADLTKVDARGANLQEAHLFKANLTDADLSDADLSGADLRKANLSRVKLINAKLDGVKLTDTIIPFFVKDELDRLNLVLIQNPQEAYKLKEIILTNLQKAVKKGAKGLYNTVSYELIDVVKSHPMFLPPQSSSNHSPTLFSVSGVGSSSTTCWQRELDVLDKLVKENANPIFRSGSKIESRASSSAWSNCKVS